MLRLRTALVYACLTGAIACSIYTEELLEDGSGGSSSASGGQGGSTSQGGGTNQGGNTSQGGSTSSQGGGGSLEPGEPCGMPSQCASNLCVDGVCCMNSCQGDCESCAVSGSEGSCAPVPSGQDPDMECGADVCNGAGQCSCGDGNQNGGETALDCGGPGCTPCADGLACNMASDCQSGVCAGTCQPPSCNDLVQNGNETGLDCGGGCMPCANGLGCALPGDCQSGICTGMICQAPSCGDGMTTGNEQCDDGNTDDFDGCASTCRNPVTHLLISEFSVSPTGLEFIEIFNPTNAPVNLANVYLADFNSYYLVANGTAAPVSADFLARFPASATIAANGFVVVSLENAAMFQATYGMPPDFDFDASDLGAPAMLGQIGSTAGLTNTDEMLVLFSYSGGASVQDLDYVVYGNTSDGMDKTGIGSYLAETPIANQISASAPGNTASSHRCDTSEASETKTGGNGISGHDETSESGMSAFKNLALPTPKAPPPAGFCP